MSMEPVIPFPLFTSFKKGISVRGYTLFEILAVPETRAKAEKYVFDHLQNGTFKPRIARVFKLEHIVDAHRFMESNLQTGNIVVTV